MGEICFKEVIKLVATALMKKAGAVGEVFFPKSPSALSALDTLKGSLLPHKAFRN
jgi:hypothetical protein